VLIGQLKMAIYQRESPLTRDLRLAAMQSAGNINNANIGHYSRRLGRVLPVDVFKYEPWLRDLVRGWVSENVSLITSIAANYLGQVENTLYRAVREGWGRTVLRAAIQEQFGTTKYRARLIARDQVSKLNGQITESRDQQLGIKRYVWRTSDDERVRPDHRRLDGTIQRWDKPPVTVTSGKRAGERNHPGGDVACRCWPDPLLEGDTPKNIHLPQRYGT